MLVQVPKLLAVQATHDKAVIEALAAEAVKALGGTWYSAGVAQVQAQGQLDHRNFARRAAVPNQGKVARRGIFPAQMSHATHATGVSAAYLSAVPDQAAPRAIARLAGLEILGVTFTFSGGGSITALAGNLVVNGTTILALPTAALVAGGTYQQTLATPKPLFPGDVFGIDPFTPTVTAGPLLLPTWCVWLRAVHVR